jgi:signal transduction histidine kinase
LKAKLAIVFIIIVLLPLSVLGWLGARVAAHEDERIREGFKGVLRDRLGDVERNIVRVLQKWERALIQETEAIAYDAASLRTLVARSGRMNNLFVFAPDGALIFPGPVGAISDQERAFIYRTKSIWGDRRFYLNGDENKQVISGVSHGWHPWFWEEGLRLLFWRRMQDGSVIGIETNRSRLLMEIIGELPATPPIWKRVGDGRVLLTDSQGNTLYQWGHIRKMARSGPDAILPLCPPLATWRLAYYQGEGRGPPVGAHRLPLFLSLGAVALALIVLAVWFYHAHRRSMREAAQRVTFVNQVSHELKTPLTNIRLYAELLENDVAESDDRTLNHLRVIVSESQRLSRLIGNVLTFARKQRRKLVLRTAPGIIEDHVGMVLENFQEALISCGVEVEYVSDAPEEVLFDADVIEQILTNLFSNVEKYASAGCAMRVATSQEGDTTTIIVQDHGPGIAAKDRETIFEPFRRLSNKLSDGASGTGMGLSIARDLAQLHGGDLILVPNNSGACFRLTLKTPKT